MGVLLVLLGIVQVAALILVDVEPVRGITLDLREVPRLQALFARFSKSLGMVRFDQVAITTKMNASVVRLRAFVAAGCAGPLWRYQSGFSGLQGTEVFFASTRLRALRSLAEQLLVRGTGQSRHGLGLVPGRAGPIDRPRTRDLPTWRLSRVGTPCHAGTGGPDASTIGPGTSHRRSRTPTPLTGTGHRHLFSGQGYQGLSARRLDHGNRPHFTIAAIASRVTGRITPRWQMMAEISSAGVTSKAGL